MLQINGKLFNEALNYKGGVIILLIVITQKISYRSVWGLFIAKGFPKYIHRQGLQV